MTKKSFLLTSMAVLLLSSCTPDHYINDGCTVGDTYCEANVVYKCVNAKSAGLESDKLEFTNPVFSTDTQPTDGENTFWQLLANCKSSCDNDEKLCQNDEKCKIGNNDDGSCQNAEGCKNGNNEDGSCKQDTSCVNGWKQDGSCLCPESCINGCNEDGTCKQLENCKNGFKEDGSCVCPDSCSNGCSPDGTCMCSSSCVNGCKDDGSCIPTDGCKNGVDETGACKCPNGCQNGCDNKGEKCLCLSTCTDGCDELGACTCEASCVEGSSCDKNTGKCACIERCKFGCDATGSCAEVCENVECKGENEQCQAIEKEDKFEAVCVDLCKDKTCKDDEYCVMGKCIYNDVNNNHMHDQYEIAAKQGQDCRKYADCDSAKGKGNGFCDSFLGYKCSTKCTDDSQCVDDGEYHYICRPDGRCAPDTFVTVWKISNDNKKLRIPTSTADACDFTIDWGDGSKSEGCVKNSKDDTIKCEKLGNNTSIDENCLLHDYQDPGMVTVKIKGEYNRFGWPANNGEWGLIIYPYLDDSPSKLYEVKAFGPVGLGPYAFASFRANIFSALSKIDIPDATQMQDMSYTFYLSSVDYPIENWDMSHVTDMRGMFRNASKFNQPLNHWDTSRVKWMGNSGKIITNNPEGVFSYAESFNQSLEDWDTSNVVSLSYMFFNAKAFNKTINKWDTSKVMFMQGTFEEACEFDQPLDNWNTSNVTIMQQAFHNAHAFDQSLNNWDTSNVEDMSGMFYGAKKFNHAIDKWDTHKVQDMHEMFNGAEAFNQPLNSDGSLIWAVSQVTNMSNMFNGAKAFDQDISSWALGNESDFTDIFKDSNISKANYCKVFNAWKNHLNNPNDLGLNYTCN